MTTSKNDDTPQNDESSLMSINIKIPAIDKLLDYVASGIGAVVGPHLVLWNATKEAKARITEAESKAESSRIDAKAQADVRLILAKSNEAGKTALTIGSEVFAQQIEFQAKKRDANVSAVVYGAAAELEGKAAPEHEPDPDWTARFFGYVQDVSSEDLQKLWARLLAGEVEEPGRTSLRTLDLLRNLTKKDAQMFQKICDFVCDGDVIFHPSEDGLLDKRFFVYLDVVHLETIGLISDSSSYKLEFRKNNQDRKILVRYQDNALVISRYDSAPNEITMRILMLSASGREIYRAMENSFRMDYLRSFSSFLKKKKLNLSHARIKEVLPDGGLRYESLISVEPETDQTRTDAL